MTVFRTASVIFLVGLAGCETTDDASVNRFVPQDYADIVGENARLAGSFEEANEATITNPASLPVSGSATYNGVIGFNAPFSGGATETLAGGLQLTADFEDNSVNGSATNFFDTQNNTYDGTLNISNGRIIRSATTLTEFPIDSDIDGTLTLQSTSQEFTVDAELVANFHEGTDFIAGKVRGTLATPTGAIPLIDENTFAIAQEQ